VDAKHALISLLYVQQPGALPSEPTWSEADRRGQHEIKQRLEAERIFAAINAALAKHGLTSHGQCLVEGDPAEEILKLATETSADLIAMGAHRRSSIQRFFLGSVSRQVLDRSTCPVLIVRMQARHRPGDESRRLAPRPV
jgi:nucleotide-binding universal stress UspA family protein